MYNSALVEVKDINDEQWEVYDIDFLVSLQTFNKQWLCNHGGNILTKIGNDLYRTNKIIVYGDNRKTLLAVDSEKKYKGCYALIFKEDNEIYIGSSSNLYARIRQHKYDMIHNRHANDKVQEAFRKSNGKFSILQIIMDDAENQYYLEQILLDHFKERYDDRFLNKWDLAVGYYYTDRYKQNMSKMLKAHYSIKENRERLSTQMKEYHAANPGLNSERMKKTWATDEHRAKLAEYHNSEEGKLNASKGGNTVWAKVESDPEFKQKFLQKRAENKLAAVPKWKESIQGYLNSDKFKLDAEKRTEVLRTDAVRNKISDGLKRYRDSNPDKSKEHSEKLKEFYSNKENRLAQRNKNSNQFVPVVCGGVEYAGLAIACEWLGLSKNTVRGRLLSKSPMYNDWYYKAVA